MATTLAEAQCTETELAGHTARADAAVPVAAVYANRRRLNPKTARSRMRRREEFIEPRSPTSTTRLESAEFVFAGSTTPLTAP